MAQGQKITAAEIRALQSAIAAYENDPSIFSDDDVVGMQHMAEAVGIPFEPKFSLGRVLGNAAFNFVDTLAFGVIPDDWGPAQVTDADAAAATVGSIAGMVTPFGGPARAAKFVTDKAAKAVPAIERIAQGKGIGKVFPKSVASKGSPLDKANQLLQDLSKKEALRKAVAAILESKRAATAMNYGLEAGSRYAAHNLLEDPLAAPSEFIGGGLLGAGFGAASPVLAKYLPKTLGKYFPQ